MTGSGFANLVGTGRTTSTKALAPTVFMLPRSRDRPVSRTVADAPPTFPHAPGEGVALAGSVSSACETWRDSEVRRAVPTRSAAACTWDE